MVLDILEYPDPRLRKVAAPVPVVTAEIRRLVADLAETMYAAPGVGLAATQVDVHKRIIVIDVSPDSRRALAYRSDGTWALYPLTGGAAVPIPGVGPQDTSIKFVDDRTLYMAANGQLPVSVYRLDLGTGEKRLVRSFEPADKAGVSYVRNVVMSLDGSAYAYQYRRWLSNLFVASGLK